ncbi:hypothetical protein [Candidatus Proelusimicrobium excrementi]|uniref:hypothetical protein n=1 Tax=Candidatus Proelusimicrobium excrementi TaxID=3416222 RepID=UPI003CA3AEDB|nr:hypothetical protein [Elusimicrobiaceae bacterium]MBR3927712.1 hypothetical protein [Clostridia bacterium]
MNIFAALGFIALGAAISEMYHFRMWQKYLEGMRSGVSMRLWKNGVVERREQAPALRSKR